jgi:glycerol-3-phosphate acyltransferase PlsY
MLVDPLGGPAFWWPLGVGLALGYLLGSIPFGLILTRLGGAGDIRAIGSGNIGATNVLRTGRKGLAAATLAFDLLKGLLPTLAAWHGFGPDMAVLTGLGTVLGHCFPVWLRFKGGKGVATAAGVVLALSPPTLVAILALFVVLVWATRYVSLGSVSAAAAAPVVAWLLQRYQFAELFLIIAVIVVFMHRANIARLLKGTENKLSFAKKS